MADKVISASLKLDTSGATPEMKEFSKATQDAGKSLDNTNQEAKETGGTFSNLKDGLSKLPGPLGQVKGGIETVNTSLKTLAANPIVLVIVAIVAALVALYKAFASTEEGAEKIEQVMKGLGAVITVIRDRVLAFAGAIVSFFKGDFKEAIDQASKAVTGFGDEVVSAYNRAADATRRLQEAQDDLNRRINVNRAELNRDLAKSKELISDTTASYQDRLKAVTEVEAAQKKQAEDELANAKEMLSIKQEAYDLDKQSSDAADELAAAKIAVANAEQQAAADERSINKQRTAIISEEQAKRTAAAKEQADARKKIADDEAQHEKELFEQRKTVAADWNAFVQGQAADRAAKAKEQADQDKKDQDDRDKYLEDETNKIISETSKQIKAKNDQAKAEDKINKLRVQAQGAFVTQISSLLQTAADLFGKQTVAGKALAIAGATIDTFRSAVAAFRGMVETFPGPWGIAAGIAAAAVAVAAGVKNIQQIASVKVPGQGDSSATPNINAPSLTSPTAPIAPTQQGTTIDQSSIQGIGNAAIGRSYVLESDVSRDQDRSTRLNRAARLGG